MYEEHGRIAAHWDQVKLALCVHHMQRSKHPQILKVREALEGSHRKVLERVVTQPPVNEQSHTTLLD